jgi:hypothetical protein
MGYVFYGHWVYFVAIWYISWLLVNFSSFWYILPRKIWQPWAAAAPAVIFLTKTFGSGALRLPLSFNNALPGLQGTKSIQLEEGLIIAYSNRITLDVKSNPSSKKKEKSQSCSREVGRYHLKIALCAGCPGGSML